jgi:hypothetical protein
MPPFKTSHETTKVAVRDSLAGPSLDSRIIGNKVLLSRHSPRTHESTWRDEDDFTFPISEGLSELSHDTKPSPTTTFPLVYDAGDAHAVWKIGNAYLKVMKGYDPLATRDHVTLKAMNNRNLSF